MRRVFFHATPEKNKNEIIANGFRFDPNGLQSMSFGTNSTVALNYAIAKRETQPGDWCILVVRYEEIAESKRFDFGGTNCTIIRSRHSRSFLATPKSPHLIDISKGLLSAGSRVRPSISIHTSHSNRFARSSECLLCCPDCCPIRWKQCVHVSKYLILW